MFKKGDVINAIPPKEYGEWSCLMFTEDAKPVHGNPLKYMGKARPVCQAYQDEPELGRNLFCHSCRHQCPQREYMVKYVGRFEPQEAQPQTAAKMVEKTTKHSGAEGETHNGDLETLMSQRKTKKQVYDGSTVTEKKKTSSTESKKAERDLQREQTLLQQQAEVNIVSPFLMQTITSGEAICGKVPVFFVVLELVEGQELGEYIAAIHNLSDRSDTSWRCLDLIRQLLLAIRAYAKPYNNRYYVHRDLKPSNMMVKIEWENGMPFQQLKIIDFDMLVVQNHIREDNVYLGGTPGYVHPEAYRLKNLPKDTKRQFSHQWDLYAAGLIIYEIMEGHPYFKDDSYLSDPEKAFVLDMGEKSETALEYPELVEIMRKLLTNTAEGYTDIDQVIEDYQQFLEVVDTQWYRDYFLRNWLECGHDFDKGLAFCKVYCHISSEGLKDVRQNFCVNANSAVPLVYGKNIMGADCLSGSQMVQKEIGAFYYIIRPDGHCVLQFMPLNENCRVRGASGNNLEEGTEIYDADVKIVIDRIE